MKKNALIIALLTILILSFCACGKSGNEKDTSATPEDTQTTGAASDIDMSLVGNWKESIFDSGFIFNADGTGTDTFWDLTFTYSCENGEVLIVYDTDLYGASKYTYSVTGDSLSMTRIDEEETSSFTYTKTVDMSGEAGTTSEEESAEEQESPEG